jgi:plastocyanin
MSAIGKFTRSPRARAAGATLLAGGTLAYAGVAGAAEGDVTAAADTTISAVGNATEGQWDKGNAAPVEIATGDTVTWAFPGATHNVASTAGNPGDGAVKDPRWDPYAYPGEFMIAPQGSSTEYTFYKSGTYNFICEFHPNMTGAVVVTGTDQDIPAGTPTPEPTSSAGPSPSATATPPGGTGPGTAPPADDHTTTPRPVAATEVVAPAVRGIELRARRRTARVTFTLSEAATVTLQIRKRGSREVLRTFTVQVRAGKRTVALRGGKLRRGRYTVTLTARDSSGNRSEAASAALRIRR